MTQSNVMSRSTGEEKKKTRSDGTLMAEQSNAELREARDQALAKAEAAQRRVTFLTEAGSLLAASLDYEAALANVARHAVPFLADWCVIDQCVEDGGLRRLAVAPADETKADLVREINRRYPADAPARFGPAQVVRTGRAELVRDIPNFLLTAVAQETEHLRILHEMGAVSYLCIPLVARERTLGVLTFVFAESRRQYDVEDVALAEDLSRRCAVAIDSAQLYHAAQAELVAHMQAQERYRLLIEGLKDYAIFIVDRDGLVTGWNTAAEQIFGYQTNEITGRHVSCLYTPEDVQLGKPRSKLARAEKDGRVVDDSWRVRKDGTRFWANIVTTRLCDEEGRTVGFSQITRDLTERMRAQEEMLKASKLESIGILAGGIAHDFNNILTAIISNLYLAKEPLSPKDPSYQRLAEAERATLRAKDLSQQLLTFSKGGAPITHPASLVELVKVSANFALQGSQTRCTFSIPSTLWAAQIDEGQISQVINNMVINAQQAMPEGGTILIRGKNTTVKPDHHLPHPLTAGRYVVISITDNGVGIREDHLTKVFDPFFTTKPKGSGLGLSTSYLIVKRHGGHITVKSEIGKGTTFSIYLPAATTSAPSIKRIEEEVALPGTGRILLMDDEAWLREPLSQALSGLGYDVSAAKDGMDAIDLYQRALDARRPFDAVILDLTVPGGMGGRETIAKLRELNPDVKAIVSSGYSDDPVMAQYREHGFVGVVKKPYPISALSDLLRRSLGTARTEETSNPPPPTSSSTGDSAGGRIPTGSQGVSDDQP